MQITVYLDVLFLTNFLSNLFLLEVTEKLVRTGLRRWRRLVSALLGSMYACLSFFPALSFLQGAVLRILTALVMLCIAFRFCTLRRFLRCTTVFFCATLLSGGACYALFFMTPLGIKTGAVLKSGVFYWLVPVYVLLGGFGAVYALLYAFEHMLAFCIQRRRALHRLEFEIGQEHYCIPALLDTGNALFDTVRGLPVIIAEADSIHTDTAPLRRIPYRTLTGETKLLPILRPAHISIDGGEVRAMLALTSVQLSYENQFRALLHPACIQGGYYEHTADA